MKQKSLLNYKLMTATNQEFESSPNFNYLDNNWHSNI